MTKILIEVENLITHLHSVNGTVQVVDDVSFRIRRGETFALVGESGCGKSMTALSLMRLLPQGIGELKSGSIYFKGTDLFQLSELEMRSVRGKNMAMIFQEPTRSLNPVFTVGQQISEVLRRHLKLKGHSCHQRVVELLDAVGIPDPEQRCHEYPHQFSGGMKQRVMIAIALACEPDLLIADEPTTALDVTIQAQVLDLLRELQKKRGMAIMLITHDLGVVAEMADQVAVMYAGEIIEMADQASFFAKPRHPYSQRLFQSLPDMDKRHHQLATISGFVPSLIDPSPGCRFASRCELAIETCHQHSPEWQTLFGNPVDEIFQRARCHRLSETLNNLEDRDQTLLEKKDGHNRKLLNVSKLRVYFPIRRGLFKRIVGHVKAVDGVSLEICHGHTLALVGESGCGKTTTGKGILQLISNTAGEICFDGQDLRQSKSQVLRDLRSEFQIIFQDPFSSMNPRMMVSDIIEEGMIAQSIGDSHKTRQKRVAELLIQVGLSAEVKNRYPHEFSGGQRQRVCIARALAVNPKLIVCDEPTSALDISIQAQVLNLLKELQIRYELSYLFITHNLSVVKYMADEVAVMYLGRIVEQGTVYEVLNHPKHPYTKALLSAVPSIKLKHRAELIHLEGDMPSPSDPPQGCHFHPRCNEVLSVCRQRYPEKKEFSESHCTHCHLY